MKFNSMESAPKDGTEIVLLIKQTEQFHLTSNGRWQEIVKAKWIHEQWDIEVKGFIAGWLPINTEFYCCSCGRHRNILMRINTIKGRRHKCAICNDRAAANSSKKILVPGRNGALIEISAEKVRISQGRRVQKNYKNDRRIDYLIKKVTGG